MERSSGFDKVCYVQSETFWSGVGNHLFAITAVILKG